MTAAPEPCTATCVCERSHWRLEGEVPHDRWYWRPGINGCEHSRHDDPDIAYFGACKRPAGAGDSWTPRRSAGKPWIWLVVYRSESSLIGWEDTEAEALQALADLAAAGMPLQRCDLVATDHLKHLEEQERRYVELERSP